MSFKLLRCISSALHKSRLQSSNIRNIHYANSSVRVVKYPVLLRANVFFSNSVQFYAKDSESPEANGSEDTREICKKTEITQSQLTEMIESKNIQLFDVRDAKDVEESGLIGPAVNIPLNELKTALTMPDDEFNSKYKVPKPQTKDDNIIFYGFIDVKSSSAVQLAHNLGYKKARHFPAGWKSWSGQE